MSNPQDASTKNENEGMKEETKSPVENNEMKPSEPEENIMKPKEKEETETSEKEEMETSEKEEMETLEKEEMGTSEKEKMETSEKEEMETSEKEGAETSEKEETENLGKKERKTPEKDEMQSPETQKTEEKKSSERAKGGMTSGKKVEIVSPEKKEKSEEFETLFDLYANFGDRDGSKGITIKNTEKWYTQAGILGDKMKVTKADIIKCFSLIAKEKERLNLTEFKAFVKTLALEKSMKEQEMAKMLIDAGRPKISGVSDLFSTICRPCC